MKRAFAFAAIFAVGAHEASGISLLRGGPPAVAGNVTSHDVEKLHQKMEGVASALEKMVDGSSPQGSLADAKIAPELRTFVAELKKTLSATAHPKDLPSAMTQLKTAQASMKDLTTTLTAHQVELMHEGDAEEESLLLGVLMTRRSKPFADQLEVLHSSEFGSLEVSKALLASHDSGRPLFEQAAAYLDKHSTAKHIASASQQDGEGSNLKKTLKYFSKRVDVLEREEASIKKSHDEMVAKLDAIIKKGPTDKAHKFTFLKKKVDRDFRKRMLKHQQETKMMKSVVVALERGDVEALKKAQDALQASMKAMQSQTGNFLHLLQLGHRLSSTDCPYCAAQCIDKCHTAGNPYAQCLADCADAGK